ncbi:MAG: metallophosphatase family protein [Bacteroidales bacterium]|nr:metallophosphatase family protein [Bacteroidales bacterium]
MKRIGILSDTHSLWDDRYAKYFSGCDEIWHAGDIGDLTIIDRLEKVAPVVRAVYGNIDSQEARRRFKEMEIFTTDGVKVVMTHIGGYPGRYAPGIRNRLDLSAPNVFVSGHSHILKIMPDREFNLLHINPGAAGKQGWQTVRTLVIITINNGAVTDAEVIELAEEKVKLK